VYCFRFRKQSVLFHATLSDERNLLPKKHNPATRGRCAFYLIKQSLSKSLNSKVYCMFSAALWLYYYSETWLA